MAAIMRSPPAWVKMKNLIAARCLPSWPQMSITKNIGTSMSSHMKAKRKRSLARKTPLMPASMRERSKWKKGTRSSMPFQEAMTAATPEEAGEGEEGQGKAVEGKREGRCR